MRDPQLDRYAALAARVHALLRDPDPDSLAAPPEAAQLLALAVHRLGLYVSAMPGAQPPVARELDALRAGNQALARAGRRPPGAGS